MSSQHRLSAKLVQEVINLHTSASSRLEADPKLEVS